MTNREQNILHDYLAPHARSFWEWSADASAVVWADSGKTIAFREELAGVLKRLSPRGLPRFGAVVLLLAAWRENWFDVRSAARILGRYKLLDASGTSRAADLIIGAVLPLRIQQDVQGVLDELDRLAQFSPALRKSAEAKGVLAEAVFGAAEAVLPADDAIGVAENLARGVSSELLQRTTDEDENYACLADEIESLRLGLPGIDEEGLTNRIKTSLDRLPNAAEVEPEPIPVRARRLIATLRSDEELGGVAALAAHVLAAFQMPRSLHHSDELPVGGVSDITNRGTFDRLLLSELAHDDLTLTVRVALNEALYLRRETPAKATPITRAILLDTGIRMWGLPRVYGVAVALALVASAPEHAQVQVFVAEGNGVREVSLSERDGLVDVLGRLEATVHMGDALPAFARKQEKTAGELETILITHSDALEDDSFVHTLSAFGAGNSASTLPFSSPGGAADDSPRRKPWDTDAIRFKPQRGERGVAGPFHVATVTRDGDLTVFEHSQAGRRISSEARLDITTILAPKPKPAALPVPRAVIKRPSLPAFLQYQPVPLLLPADPRAAILAESEKYNLVGVTADRRIVVWDSKSGQGARELVSTLPAGASEAVFVDDAHDTAYVVLLRKRENRIGILSVRLDSGAVNCSWIPGNKARAVWYRSNVFVFAHDRGADCVHLPTLTRKHLTIPLDRNLTWLNARYYKGLDGCYAVVFNGSELVLEKLSGHEPIGVAEDRAGQLVVVDRSLALYYSDGTHVTPATSINAVGGPSLLGHSRRGIVVHAWTRNGPEHAALEWDNPQQWHACRMPPQHWTYGQRMSCGATDQFEMRRRKFSSIGMGKDGLLALGSRDDYLVLTQAGSLQSHHRQASSDRILKQKPFVPGRTESMDYRLRTARWADGSMAVLDNRGLLHLKSSVKDLPEITLILSSPTVGAWISDGRGVFDKYFGECPSPAAWSDVDGLIRKFTRNLRG